MPFTSVADACTIETKPHLWDLGGSIQATIENTSDPDAPPLTVHEGQELKVTVTLKLTGKVRHYLCGTWICICLAWESCGPGCEDERCCWIQLTGENDPCTTDTYTCTFDLPGDVLKAGGCGREYELCITLGSKDCCGKVGFVFGSCKPVAITVLPAIED